MTSVNEEQAASETTPPDEESGPADEESGPPVSSEANSDDDFVTAAMTPSQLTVLWLVVAIVVLFAAIADVLSNG
jgi:hypothetical protein